MEVLLWEEVRRASRVLETIVDRITAPPAQSPIFASYPILSVWLESAWIEGKLVLSRLGIRSKCDVVDSILLQRHEQRCLYVRIFVRRDRFSIVKNGISSLETVSTHSIPPDMDHKTKAHLS